MTCASRPSRSRRWRTASPASNGSAPGSRLANNEPRAMPSSSSRRAFIATPPGAENPPAFPSEARTRWHGTASSSGLRPKAWPTARAAPRFPSRAAISPYVAVLPAGSARTASYTRRWNSLARDRSSGMKLRSCGSPARWRSIALRASRTNGGSSMGPALAIAARASRSVICGSSIALTPESVQRRRTGPAAVWKSTSCIARLIARRPPPGQRSAAADRAARADRAHLVRRVRRCRC